MAPSQLNRSAVLKAGALRALSYFSAIGIIVALSACGEEKPKDSNGSDVIPAAADAGTDAVPQPSVEGALPPAADASAATPGSQIDPNAANSSNASDNPTNSANTMNSTDVASAQSASSSDERRPSDQPDTYQIKSGDTLMKIAFDVFGDVFRWREIYEANRDQLSNPNIIPSGVVLKVVRPAAPPTISQNGEKYIIKQGDTLGKISNELYGTPTRWKEIWENNKQLIRNPNKIFAGFYLYYIPNGGQKVSSAYAPAPNYAPIRATATVGRKVMAPAVLPPPLKPPKAAVAARVAPVPAPAPAPAPVLAPAPVVPVEDPIPATPQSADVGSTDQDLPAGP